MKIIHIIDSDGLYGAEVMLLTLAEEQVRFGYSVEIISIGTPAIKQKSIEIEANKRGVMIKPFRIQAGLNFRGGMLILKYCQQQNAALLHSHGYKGNILLGMLPRLIRQIPILSTVHGWTSTTGISKMLLNEWMDGVSLRFVDGVVLVNKNMLKHRRIKRLDKAKLYTIDNGLPLEKPDTSTLGPIDERIVTFCSSGYVVGSIGRYSKEKAFDDLIEAFVLFVEVKKDAKLILIGEGEERLHYEEIIKNKSLEEKVLLTGYCENGWRYLDFMNIYVISSLTEGLPITLLEAMRAEVPIVATKVGGIPEALEQGEAGLLVEPGDINAMVAALLHCTSETSDSNERLIRAATVFRVNYSSEVMAEKYSLVYKQLVV